MTFVLPQHIELTDMLTSLTFCSLDLETTGTNPALHKIVEIGMIKFNLEKQLDEYESLINPEGSIPQNVIDIHGITNDMVQDSPTIQERINEIYKFIGDSVLVIHNPRFDLSFLKTVKVNGVDTKEVLQAIDTVKMARKAFPYFPNHKLKTLCYQFDLDIDSHHRALSDAYGCKEVFRRSIVHLDPDGNWTLDDLLNYHGALINPRYKRKIVISDVHIFGIKIGESIKIRYKNSAGCVTVREIIPEKFVRVGGKKYVHAYCNLRKEYRYFKANRIRTVL